MKTSLILFFVFCLTIASFICGYVAKYDDKKQEEKTISLTKKQLLILCNNEYQKGVLNGLKYCLDNKKDTNKQWKADSLKLVILFDKIGN